MAIRPYDERLHALLRAAAHVFATKGFHPTTMRDLSRATGMSLAGMYHYVDGKEELLFQIQRQCFAAVAEGANEAVGRAGPDPIERLQAFVRHHVTFFAGHMDEMKVLSHDAESLSGERKQFIVDLKRDYVDQLGDLVAALGSDGDGRIGAYALFGMMNWIYTWYRPDGPVPPDVLAERFVEIALTGLRGEPVSVGRSR